MENNQETTLLEDLESLCSDIYISKITLEEAIQTIHNISNFYKGEE
tara:strand:- start:1064 stop:1201 length:138 start_codon:yes stop_codon:yes gene_type:complete